MPKKIKYFKCPENRADIRVSTLTKIQEWARSDELGSIVNVFGGEIPQTDNIKTLVDWLLEFSDIWDYREKQKKISGKKIADLERWQTDSDDITNEQAEVVFRAIGTLGLIGVQHPMSNIYDYIIALGGARLSCLLRPRYASHIIDNVSQKPKAAVMLSGARPISDAERETTDTYAPGAVSEFDLINRGAELAFGLDNIYREIRYDDKTNINNSWALRTYKEEKTGLSIISIAAPSTEPDKRRANSVDTYKFFFERYDVKPGERLLLVTNQIYVPYQQLEAIRTLAIPMVIVETVGLPNEWTNRTQVKRGADKYLQEIRSTIQAMDRFLKQGRGGQEFCPIM